MHNPPSDDDFKYEFSLDPTRTVHAVINMPVAVCAKCSGAFPWSRVLYNENYYHGVRFTAMLCLSCHEEYRQQ